jgi:predicted GTPase
MPSMEEHAENLGKLVANMQSLEFALRAFLLNVEIIQRGPLPQLVKNLHDVNEGDIVPLNALTNYDNLRQLITKYNNHPKILSANLTIDKTLVDIRDAIAHGRISSPNPSASLKLLKFDKPKINQVKVAFSALMTKGWFKEWITRYYNALMTVNKAIERLQSGRL